MVCVRYWSSEVKFDAWRDVAAPSNSVKAQGTMSVNYR